MSELTLITTYIEKKQDRELRAMASEVSHLGISRAEILRVCLSLGLDSLRELIADVKRDGVQKCTPSGFVLQAD